MSDDFRDALIDMVWREIKAAQKAGDIDRCSAVIADLAEILGKSIAMVGHGDREVIDKMLAGSENTVAEIATDIGGLISGFQQIAKGSR